MIWKLDCRRSSSLFAYGCLCLSFLLHPWPNSPDIGQKIPPKLQCLWVHRAGWLEQGWPCSGSTVTSTVAGQLSLLLAGDSSALTPCHKRHSLCSASGAGHRSGLPQSQSYWQCCWVINNWGHSSLAWEPQHRLDISITSSQSSPERAATAGTAHLSPACTKHHDQGHHGPMQTPWRSLSQSTWYPGV